MQVRQKLNCKEISLIVQLKFCGFFFWQALSESRRGAYYSVYVVLGYNWGVSLSAGRAVAGAPPVPLHGPAASGKGAKRGQLQIEGKGSNFRNVAGQLPGRRGRSLEELRHFFRPRLAYYERGSILQVRLHLL